MRDGFQLCLFDNCQEAIALDQRIWSHGLARSESSLHTLAPYPHRARVDLVRALIDRYSQPGDVVLDPFCGSGVIPLEVAIADRIAWASDLHPYAYCLTRGKLEAPRSQRRALQQVADLIDAMAMQADERETAPAWVQDFFHPETLRELVVALRVLRSQANYFLLACLLGIVQDVGRQALSYPTDADRLFLRSVTYSAAQFPELYGYRDLRSRLIAKVKKVYRRHGLPLDWEQRSPQIWHSNCTDFGIANESVNTIITSPPHAHAFDYVRSHRLRLWCLGYQNTKAIHESLIYNSKIYADQMAECFREMLRVLKVCGYCVLLVSESNGKSENLELLMNLATTATQGHLSVEMIYNDAPPGKPVRKATRDRILVLQKI
jgi:hypothetical protein